MLSMRQGKRLPFSCSANARRDVTLRSDLRRSTEEILGLIWLGMTDT
jgi:hypothetical protein